MHWTIYESPAARCTACGCHAGSLVQAVPGDGPSLADIALVGEALGETEEERSLPFVGRAGDMLNGCIHEAELARAELFITNTVRCRPTNEPQPGVRKNRKPTMTEIDACRGYLVDELSRVKPRVIVTLGDVAMTSVLGKMMGGVSEHVCKVIWSEEFNAHVVVTYHPAYALRKYPMRHWIVEALKVAKDVLARGGPKATAQTDVRIVESVEEMRTVRDALLNGAEFAFDTETNGVHLVKSRAFIYSFSNREGCAWVVPRYGSEWSMIWSKRELPEIDNLLREILFSDHVEKHGFHLAYDNCLTRSTLGVWPRGPQFCWMLAHHLYANHLGEGAHNLKLCANQYTPMGRYDDALDQWLLANGHTFKGKPDMGKVWLAPDELVRYYAGCDADATLRIKNVLKPRLIAEQLWTCFVDERMPLMRRYQEFDRDGVRIDEHHLSHLSELLGEALSRMQRQLAEYAEREDFNPGSHDQVRDLLYEKIGLPILGRTDTGKPGTNEEILKQLREVHPAVDILLHYRTHEKIKGTWIDGKDSESGHKKALRAVLDDDGYARMNTRLHGTETLRLATRAPFAIHTFPKTDPKTGIPSVRALIIPKDGWKIVSRDYSQQEWAVQAIIAGQQDMVEAIIDRGEDIHEMVTRDLGGEPKEAYLSPTGTYPDPEKPKIIYIDRHAYDTYKKLRQSWKSTNFAILFLAGERQLARMAFGCTSDKRAQRPCKKEGTVDCSCPIRAAEYMSNYFERFEAIKWWQYNVKKTLKETGEVRERFGARRKLPGIFDNDFFTRLEAERAACNFPVQRGGGAVMFRAVLRAAARIEREKLPARIMFTLHDEMIGEAREDVAERLNYVMQWAMEAPYRELDGRSLRSDGGIFDCWGG